MDRNTNFLSELEAELEAEFDSEQQPGSTYELDSELDNEADNEYDQEQDNEFELESGSDSEFEFELESNSDNEFETDDEFELEYDGGSGRSYESRIQQLLSNPRDNELEFDQELNQVIHEMEQEFFFKGLKKLARKGLRKFKAIAGRTPLGQIVTTATSLARGNIRNVLRKAAGLALRAGTGFIPGGAMLAPMAAKALNLETSADQESPFQKAKGLVSLARNSYQNLARQLDPQMMNTRTANAVAKTAVSQAMKMANRQHRPSSPRRNGVVVEVSLDTWQKISEWRAASSSKSARRGNDHGLFYFSAED